jgi:hypothetical protein
VLVVSLLAPPQAAVVRAMAPMITIERRMGYLPPVAKPGRYASRRHYPSSP